MRLNPGTGGQRTREMLPPVSANGAVRACVYADGLYSVSYRDENQYY
jgi:hypothetical protein